MVNLNGRITRKQFLSALGSFSMVAFLGCQPDGTGSVKLDPSIKSKRKFSKDNLDIEVGVGKPKGKGKRK